MTTQGQADIFEFDGPDYNPTLDDDRLTDQYHRIFNLMSDGKWRTLSEIAFITGDPQASISAQLRHMRKPRFGAHIVRKERVQGREADGLFEYQLSIKGKEENDGCTLQPAHKSSNSSEQND